MAWFSPQSEYRPTEYLQSWVRFWFDDALRLRAAKALQRTRLERIRETWLESRLLREAGFNVAPERLTDLLQRSSSASEAAPETAALLTAEARLTKALFRLAVDATGYGDFTRAKGGSGARNRED